MALINAPWSPHKTPKHVHEIKLTATDFEIQRQLEQHHEHATETLQHYIDKGTASIQIAHLCLETFFNSLQKMPLLERKEQIRARRAGARTLHWLWDRKLHLRTVFLGNYPFRELLFYFLVAEDLDDYITGWLKAEAAETLPKNLRGWRGMLIMDFIRAKFVVDGDGNSALDCYFSMWNRINAFPMQRGLGEGRGEKSQDSPSMWPATVYLCRVLPSRRSLDISAQRYDNLLAILRGYRSKGSEQYHVAKLELWHPSGPRAETALALLRSHYDDDKETFLNTTDTKAPSERQSENLYYFLARTAVVLKQNGRLEDAKWIATIVEKKFPNKTAGLWKAGARRRPATDLYDRRLRSRSLVQCSRVSGHRDGLLQIRYHVS